MVAIVIAASIIGIIGGVVTLIFAYEKGWLGPKARHWTEREKHLCPTCNHQHFCFTCELERAEKVKKR